jgi:hypothetical protein
MRENRSLKIVPRFRGDFPEVDIGVPLGQLVE